MKACIILAILALGISICWGQEPYRGATMAKSNPPKGKQVVISVNGTPIKFDDVQPQAVAGFMMVPLRGAFEALGIYVEYNPAVRTITARRDSDDVELRIGEKVAHKNGAEILLQVAPLLMKGHAMVPLRFLVETLGGKVNYDPATRQIDIVTNIDHNTGM